MTVKICGIRSLEEAKFCKENGTDFLGFNFVVSSKRFINIDTALEIINKLGKGIKTVGVFQNEPAEMVNFIAEKLNLDYVQLHGEEDLEYCQKIKTKIVKAFRIKKGMTEKNISSKIRVYNKNNHQKIEAEILRSKYRSQNDKRGIVKYYLLDREEQGKGDMLDFNIAKKLCQEFPIILAGGLNPENVGNAVLKVKPFGVDVAGGVEADGVIDLSKVALFIKNAKGLYART